ncbi:hypothetical protein STANM309S_03548 [Streptomyces tanashiensis]
MLPPALTPHTFVRDPAAMRVRLPEISNQWFFSFWSPA